MNNLADDMSLERKEMQEIREKGKYLVVCLCENNGKTQVSSDVCKSINIPPTIEDVNRMLEELKKVKNAKNVVILNWLLLSDENETCCPRGKYLQKQAAYMESSCIHTGIQKE